MKAFLLALLLLLLLVPGLAHAHGLRTRYVEITIVSATTATVALRDSGLTVDAEPGCSVRAGALAQITCARGIAGVMLGIGGLAANDSAVVLVRDRAGVETTTVLTARAPHVSLPGHGAAGTVAARYVALGVEHVLGGIDHVLLLLALFWGAWRSSRRIKELFRLATAFTVAHSVSLAATTLGFLHVSSVAAEAAIALSLVLVALDRVPRERLGLVAVFGLVHGLGFAGALAEVGLPDGAVPIALLAFNVGVEIAQALILGGCLLLAFVALRLFHAARGLRVAEGLTAYAVGITGAFLFFVRTSLFLR